MSKSNRPARGGPITSNSFPVCAPDESTQSNDSRCGGTTSTAMPVALYRITADGTDYYSNILPDKSAAAMIPEMLHEIFKLNSGTPKLNARSIEQLEARLNKAIDAMKMGILADVRLVFPVAGVFGTIGFHRAPVAADRCNDSILALAMNRHGHLSEMRLPPSSAGLEVKAAAFGMDGVHYV